MAAWTLITLIPLILVALMMAPSLGAGEAPATQPTTRVVVYKKTTQADLSLEIFSPADCKASDKRPAIVFFFGGAWAKGTRAQFATQAQHLAARGMVAITADYRIRSLHQTTPADAVEDARSTMRWVRKHAAELGVDPDRLAAGGGSAGGHLAAATALCPGPDAKDDDLSISCKPSALVLFNPVMSLMGEAAQKIAQGETAEKLSPNRFVAKGDPPAILFYGSQDEWGATGREFVQLSTKAGNRAEQYIAAGQAHAFFNRSPWREATLAMADEFLVSLGYLKGNSGIQVPADAKLELEKLK